MNLDLEFFLLAATVVTGGIVLANRLILGKIPKDERHWLHDIACSFFPILLIVIALRSFVVEPFRIPSGSMMPTLEIGDFILVNKYTYGLRFPVSNTEILELGSPHAGDIAVFRYPNNPKQDFIKRIIGTPGDLVEYRNKKLYINGRRVPQTYRGDYKKSAIALRTMRETLNNNDYDTLVYPDAYTPPGRWRVPYGHYFVVGDNRDNSNDSRVWGFVPRENLVGKAFLIWFNLRFDQWSIDTSRIGMWLQ